MCLNESSRPGAIRKRPKMNKLIVDGAHRPGSGLDGSFRRVITRYSVLTVILLAAIFTIGRGAYEGHLWTGISTCIIDLDRAFFFFPPPVPAYSEFVHVFDDLPAEADKQFVIRRVWVWQEGVIEFFLLMLPIGLACSIIYLPRHKQHQDYCLLYVSMISMGFLVSSLCSCLIYAIVGGWGPPAPLGFGIFGLTMGLIATALAWLWAKSRL